MRKHYSRVMTALSVAVILAMVLTTTAIAQGTVPGTPSNPKTTTSNGVTKFDCGTGYASYDDDLDDPVTVGCKTPATSPLAPTGYDYASNSFTLSRPDGFVGMGDFVVMCWVVPAGATWTIMRLNQFGIWNLMPSVSYTGGTPHLICTMSNLVGTYAPFVAED